MNDSYQNPLQRLYQVIQRATGALDRLHADRLRCRRGCSNCCVDDLTVFEIEADYIRHHHATLLANADPGPKGACAFLDPEGACRIYEHRPYVCRTQGYPLRWEKDAVDDDGTECIVELRDICPLNEDGPPVETLPASACWTLGPAELRLSRVQSQRGKPGARNSLRSLFSREHT